METKEADRVLALIGPARSQPHQSQDSIRRSRHERKLRAGDLLWRYHGSELSKRIKNVLTRTRIVRERKAASAMNTEFQKLCEWLEHESAKRTKEAIARRADAKSGRGKTAKELRAEKAMAEKIFGRKLDLVSTKPEDSERSADIQDRIAAKLEAEARQLSAWADLIRAQKIAEPPKNIGQPSSNDLTPVFKGGIRVG